MAKQKYVPMLRFPEFQGEWISEIFDNTTSITRLAGYEYSAYWKEDESMEIIALRGYNIGKGRLVLRDLGYISNALSLQLGRSKLFRGDIVYPCVGSIGNACVIEEDNKYHIQQNIAKITCKEGYSPYFFAQFLMSHLGKGEVDRFNATSSQPNVLVGSLRNFRISLPSFPEQQKIASFLTAVDDKIQQLSKKKALLEQYKKGVMQQLFTQKLRFKDDQGNAYPDWEERTLGELCKVAKSGGTPTSTKPEYYDGDIPFLSISDMTKQGKYLNYTSNHISILGLKNSTAWILPINTLIYSMYASVGFVSINKIALATSQAVLNIIPVEEVSTEFLYYSLVEFQDKTHKFITTGTQGNLNAQTVKGFPVGVPCYPEQTKIFNFLSAIDDKINSVDQQIEHTRQFKKGLLQQMFV